MHRRLIVLLLLLLVVVLQLGLLVGGVRHHRHRNNENTLQPTNSNNNDEMALDLLRETVGTSDRREQTLLDQAAARETSGDLSGAWDDAEEARIEAESDMETFAHRVADATDERVRSVLSDALAREHREAQRADRIENEIRKVRQDITTTAGGSAASNFRSNDPVAGLLSKKQAAATAGGSSEDGMQVHILNSNDVAMKDLAMGKKHVAGGGRSVAREDVPARLNAASEMEKLKRTRSMMDDVRQKLSAATASSSSSPSTAAVTNAVVTSLLAAATDALSKQRDRLEHADTPSHPRLATVLMQVRTTGRELEALVEYVDALKQMNKLLAPAMPKALALQQQIAPVHVQFKEMQRELHDVGKVFTRNETRDRVQSLYGDVIGDLQHIGNETDSLQRQLRGVVLLHRRLLGLGAKAGIPPSIMHQQPPYVEFQSALQTLLEQEKLLHTERVAVVHEITTMFPGVQLSPPPPQPTPLPSPPPPTPPPPSVSDAPAATPNATEAPPTIPPPIDNNIVDNSSTSNNPPPPPVPTPTSTSPVSSSSRSSNDTSSEGAVDDNSNNNNSDNDNNSKQHMQRSKWAPETDTVDLFSRVKDGIVDQATVEEEIDHLKVAVKAANAKLLEQDEALAAYMKQAKGAVTDPAAAEKASLNADKATKDAVQFVQQAEALFKRINELIPRLEHEAARAQTKTELQSLELQASWRSAQ